MVITIEQCGPTHPHDSLFSELISELKTRVVRVGSPEPVDGVTAGLSPEYKMIVIRHNIHANSNPVESYITITKIIKDLDRNNPWLPDRNLGIRMRGTENILSECEQTSRWNLREEYESLKLIRNLFYKKIFTYPKRSFVLKDL